MMIDCDTCVVRDLACGDCVVTVLLGSAPAVPDDELMSGLDLDGREQAAIAVLAGAGMVPPLRLVTPPGDETSSVTETDKSPGRRDVGDGRRPRSA